VTSRADTLTVPDLLSIREAAAVLRIGKTCAYELAQQYVHSGGEAGLKVVRVGRQLRVPRTVLEEMLGDSVTWPIESHPVADEPVDAKPAHRHAKPKSKRSEQPPRLFPL
jgi:excisionase family DNA binding protein